jgi:methionine-rich copper-binding protein CopC
MKSPLILLLTRALAAAAALALAQSALAHAYPKHRTPSAGATVSAAQTQVSIEFDDALEPAFSSLQVADSAGKSVTSAKSSVDASDKKHMTVALEPLKPGAYTVTWVAVAADGHRTQGHYTFTVK